MLDIDEIAKRTRTSSVEVIEIIDRAKRSLTPKRKSVSVVEEDVKQKMSIVRTGVGLLQTQYGAFYQFEFDIDDKWKRYTVLLNGKIDKNLNPVLKNSKSLLMRVDSGCQSGQIFDDRNCECSTQLHQAMKIIADNGQGMIVHIPGQDGRGLGIPFKLATLSLQAELKLDTIEASYALKAEPPIDGRTYAGIIAVMKFFEIPRDMNIGLMTNNPEKSKIFRDNGYNNIELVPIVIKPTKYTRKHLYAKQKHLGHINLIRSDE